MRMFSCFLSAALGAASLCSAGTINYAIDLTIGGTGNVTGDIVTDGTLGTLHSGNILGCNLTLNDGVDPPANLVCGSNAAVEFAGNALTATASQLFYNFSDPSDNYFFIENYGGAFPDGPGVAYVCFESDFSHCYGNLFASGGSNAGESFVIDNFQNDGANSYQFTSLPGTQVLTTPEPSAAALLCLGIALSGFRKRLKQVTS